MPDLEQYATVDHRAAELIVRSYSRTTAGFWVTNEQYARLPDSVDDDELGTSIIAALDASEHDVPVPSWSGRPLDPVLRELGLRSFGRYMTGTTEVSVTRSSAGVTVTPMHNGGAKAGFTEINTDTETINDRSASTIAATVRRGLCRAT